ncbi:Rad53p [Rhizophagus irregularis DAOM 197198w]|uniref:Rad53p n=2 Tax=Rhizophagus irregularis TaxID=588596 RepID=A0A015K481_RHIIW|nr:Rad53p [Rhizophagus irregularis DAOM 197198w]
MQLEIDNLQDMIFEWIPYNQFYKVKKTGRNDIATIYSAIWKNGPLHYNYSKNELIRKSNKKITLKCLHNSRSTINEFINKDNIIFKTYGISQNPDTGNYIIVLQDKYYKEYGKSYCKQCIGKYTDIENKWCKPCQINYLKNNFKYWTSKNRKIDDFIQEIQLKINDWDDLIFEWIPYNQFNDINEIYKSSYFTIYSAIWEDGPLCYDNKMELKRVSEKKVTLKCLHYNIYNLQNIINKFLDKVNTYAGNSKIYGMSQNPYTKDYIMILQENYCTEYGQISNFKKIFMDWTNGNEQINDFIQKMQLKINSWNDTVFEWIPYSKFNDVKEIGESTVYSAIWKGGPLYYDHNSKKWIRKSDKNVILKCLITGEFLNVVKAYLADEDRIILKIYGISQNPETKEYIVVFHRNKMIYERYAKKLFTYWLYNLPTNEKVIDFIQQMQLKVNYHYDVVFEWVPYNQFNYIKEIRKGNFSSVYSAIWEDGLLYFDDNKKEWTRKSNTEVTLKYLYNSKNNINEFLDKVRTHLANIYNRNIQVYGVSQNPNTNDYIIILQSEYSRRYCEKCLKKYANIAYKWCKPCQISCLEKNFKNWTSSNKQIDNFIQKMQLNINNWNDTIIEWIPYSKFNDVKEISKIGRSSVYLATWKGGPLYYDYKNGNEWIRKSDKKVVLKYLKSKELEFLNVVKAYTTYKNGIILKVYGISRNKKDYIIVFQLIDIHERYVFYNLPTNEKVIDFIQQMQLKVNYHYDVVFEWIPYNQFNDIEEVGEGGFSTVYSAIWKDGPLYFDDNKMEWIRKINKKVALKCLHNSQNINEKFLNEAKEYSIDSLNILRIHGISQNPNTKNYIMVLQYAEGGDFNKWINRNYESFDWTNKIKVLNNIINGLKEIHQKRKVHHDLHTRNILFLFRSTSDIVEYTRISDMGLCGEVDNIDEEKIYGVMPYVAPEVLRGKLYTQAADIYSFGMVMYFIATGRQPFADRAHDELLALDICEEVRPKLNELEAPKFYIELMKRCWDSNPNNRPNAAEISDQLRFWKNVDFECAENYRKSNLSKRKPLIIHPQAVYTSRILNPYTKILSKNYNSNCSDCAIVD